MRLVSAASKEYKNKIKEALYIKARRPSLRNRDCGSELPSEHMT
jgi:hypothetical protein